MPVPDRERAQHMTLRLRRTLERLGVGAVPELAAAHEVAMAPRHAVLDDDHDPRYLHPGRSALIALGDGQVRDPVLVAAALLFESLDARLGPQAAEVAAIGSDAVARGWEVAAALPRPEDEALAERLVCAGEGERVVALAEWLDQLRHLRHWAGAECVRDAHRLTREVYLPVAERTGGALARRLRWWLRRVLPPLGAPSIVRPEP
ncbi:MAG: hypothetical protein RQ751_01270 [Longimicrobiales bacterium]|nr:hypothetical protein [Longimicrobiales bacterium]